MSTLQQKGKKSENVSSNLIGVTATATVDATADNIDKAEFQNSTVAVSTATTTVFSTEFVSKQRQLSFKLNCCCGY